MKTVKFEQDYLNNATKVFMFEDTQHGRVFYKADNTAITTQEGQSLKHEDIVFCSLPNDALPAFAEALDALGVKTDNDHKIAGVLEATKYHLEDMRKLAKVK